MLSAGPPSAKTRVQIAPARLHAGTESRRDRDAVATDSKSGAQVCRIHRVPARNRKRMAYDADEVDFFFIVVGDGSCYLIPIEEVGGALNVTGGFQRSSQRYWSS